MLTLRNKPRSWLKKEHEGISFLIQITRLFQENAALDDAFRKLGAFIEEQMYATGIGMYLYHQETGRFSLHVSHGKGNFFPTFPEFSTQEFASCGINPATVATLSMASLSSGSPPPHPFLKICAEHAILSLAHIPINLHRQLYGMILLVSPYLQHVSGEGHQAFAMIARHISVAIEDAILANQAKSEADSNTLSLQPPKGKYQLVFEEAGDAIMIVDFATRRFVEMNRQTETLVGYSRDELLTMTVGDLWAGIDEKRLTHNLLRLVEKRRAVKLQERQIIRKDGSVIWIEINASAIEYEGKQVALAIVRDVSQRKQIELEKEVIDAINKVLISSHDAQEVYTAVSQILQKMFSFERLDILLPGKVPHSARVFVSIHDDKPLIDIEDREYICEGTTIDHVFQSGTPSIVNYRENSVHQTIMTLFGQIRTSLFFPLEYRGDILGVLHFGNYRRERFHSRSFDFLRRIATQLAIAIENMILFHTVNEERAVYKHLIENVNEIVFQVDLKGMILFVNHRIQNILGYAPEEVTGVNFFTLLIPEDLEKAKAAFRLTLRHEQALSGEYRVSHKNGAILTISIYTRPIFEDGRIAGMQGIIQDITPPPRHFITQRDGLHELIGRSQKMQEIYELIMNVAKSDSTIVIHGESGTGKELIAQAIHAYSQRKNNPFIVVNCAAYSENLLESELFGHERGAFTGAHRRKLGRFELAKGGTIFLDEIGEISLHSQLLLLRVLQNRTFERVGGENTIEAEVRIVAATNKNLEEAVKAGRFREDLYYRLQVIPIDVPPLRERKEDIPYLVEHFLKKYSGATGKQIATCSPGAMDVLMRYNWFGNVRELENVIERAVVMTTGSVIIPTDLPPRLRQEESRVIEQPSIAAEPSFLHEYEKQLILKALQTTHWNKYQAAKQLGITRSTLYSKIEKYGLEPDNHKS